MEMNWFLLGIIYLNCTKLVIWQEFHISELMSFLNIKIKHTLVRNPDNTKSTYKKKERSSKVCLLPTTSLLLPQGTCYWHFLVNSYRNFLLHIFVLYTMTIFLPFSISGVILYRLFCDFLFFHLIFYLGHPISVHKDLPHVFVCSRIEFYLFLHCNFIHEHLSYFKVFYCYKLCCNEHLVHISLHSHCQYIFRINS